MDEKNVTIPKKINKTLSKFEFARVWGVRADQLARGAEPLVEATPTERQDFLLIAKMEILQKKLPIVLSREYPNGEVEDLELVEMNIECE